MGRSVLAALAFGVGFATCTIAVQLHQPIPHQSLDTKAAETKLDLEAGPPARLDLAVIDTAKPLGADVEALQLLMPELIEVELGRSTPIAFKLTNEVQLPKGARLVVHRVPDHIALFPAEPLGAGTWQVDLAVANELRLIRYALDGVERLIVVQLVDGQGMPITSALIRLITPPTALRVGPLEVTHRTVRGDASLGADRSSKSERSADGVIGRPQTLAISGRDSRTGSSETPAVRSRYRSDREGQARRRATPAADGGTRPKPRARAATGQHAVGRKAARKPEAPRARPLASGSAGVGGRRSLSSISYKWPGDASTRRQVPLGPQQPAAGSVLPQSLASFAPNFSSPPFVSGDVRTP